jgi:hypothetical protein
LTFHVEDVFGRVEVVSEAHYFFQFCCHYLFVFASDEETGHCQELVLGFGDWADGAVFIDEVDGKEEGFMSETHFFVYFDQPFNEDISHIDGELWASIKHDTFSLVLFVEGKFFALIFVMNDVDVFGVAEIFLEIV